MRLVQIAFPYLRKVLCIEIAGCSSLRLRSIWKKNSNCLALYLIVVKYISDSRLNCYSLDYLFNPKMDMRGPHGHYFLHTHFRVKIKDHSNLPHSFSSYDVFFKNNLENCNLI